MPFADEGPQPADAALGEDLARAALSGDASAWAVLIARHQQRVLVAILARGIALDRARSWPRRPGCGSWSSSGPDAWPP